MDHSIVMVTWMGSASLLFLLLAHSVDRIFFCGVLRYTVSSDMDVKSLVSEDAMKTADDRKTAKKALKKIFYEKFTNPMNEKVGKVSKDLLFLRKKLRF